MKVLIILELDVGKKIKMNQAEWQVQIGTTRATLHHCSLPGDLAGPSPRRVALISELFNTNLNSSLRHWTAYQIHFQLPGVQTVPQHPLWHVRLPVGQTRQDKHTTVLKRCCSSKQCCLTSCTSASVGVCCLLCSINKSRSSFLKPAQTLSALSVCSWWLSLESVA